jgi:hypothetical protein
VNAVKRVVSQFVNEGVIPARDGHAIMKSAATSDCGKRH